MTKRRKRANEGKRVSDKEKKIAKQEDKEDKATSQKKDGCKRQRKPNKSGEGGAAEGSQKRLGSDVRPKESSHSSDMTKRW